MKEGTDSSNFEALVDSLSISVVQSLTPDSGAKTSKKRSSKGRKNEAQLAKPSNGEATNDASGLEDFVEYLVEEIFSNLPAELRDLSYASVQNDRVLAFRYSVPVDSAVLETLVTSLPHTVFDSLASYGLVHEDEDVTRFLDPVLAAYINAVTAAPPEYTPELTASRPDGCEICQREHLPLTYHHLIPRQVHTKVVKRGWHRDWELNKVAWLCRACHSFVHKIASNEELAREWYSVERLVEREDVQKWADWVGRVRWKAR